MSVLSAELSAIVGDAFVAEGLSQAYGQVMRSDRPDGRSSVQRCSARSRGSEGQSAGHRRRIVARLKGDPIFAKVEIAGPAS